MSFDASISTGRGNRMTPTRSSRRLTVVIATVCAAGIAAFAAAAATLAISRPSGELLVGLALLFGAMLLADRFPVPLEGLDATGVSLSFVFGVAAVVLFGWAGGLVAVVAAPAVGQLLDRRSAVRVAYNTSVHGLSAGAGGLLIAPVRRDRDGRRLTLCLVDIDDFKLVNDRFGHPAGDRVLAEVAARLRQGGESFRLGGDEFALILAGASEDSAARTARSIVERIAAVELEVVGSVTVSAGLASTEPARGDQGDLIRRADGALYTAKQNGKNSVRLAAPELGLGALRRLGEAVDNRVRRRAAESLAAAVDERDASAPGNSLRVGELAARIAVRLGVEPDEVELVWLAGSLHDLGKLAIPEEILRKRDPLTPEERSAVEGHAKVGSSMLADAAAEPIARWVRHHHERWDGSGYPDGILAGEIPLGARILFVADAYQAMTSSRPYRAALTPREALTELRRCAGTQFDPEIVSALADEVGLAARRADALASY